MSKMIPRETIDALRHQVNVTLDNFGIDCHLFIPTTSSYNDGEEDGPFSVPGDLEYTEYTTRVFIEWGASVYRLKKLGLFVEGMLPLIAHFGTKATAVSGSEAGEEVDVDIFQRCYFTITPEFIPNDYEGIESFEIVNRAIPEMHDAAIRGTFSLAPRRTEET